jgi:hypothetical protein
MASCYHFVNAAFVPQNDARLPLAFILGRGNKPTQIEMTEGQYAWFAGLFSANGKEFKGIPIVFTDGARWL